MKKFYLVLTAIAMFVAVLGEIFMVVTTYIGLNSPEVKHNLPPNYNAALVLGIWIPFMVWNLATGIGLLLKKNWARYSVMVISGFAVIVGAFSVIIMFMMPFLTDVAGSDSSSFWTFMIFYSAFMGIFFILFPVINFVFFTRPSVKEIFMGNGPQAALKRPRGITFLAILYFLSGIFLSLMFLFPMYQAFPIIGNIMISGIFLRIYLLMMAALSFYLGYGFWKLKKGSWIAFIILAGYGILVSIVNFFTLDVGTLNKMMPEGYPNYNSTLSIKLGIAFSMIFGALFIYYVYSKKSWFYGEKPLSENPVQGGN